MRINRKFFRYFAYALEILILYILQGTPNLVPEISGSKPLLLMPVAISIAAREKQIPSLVFGAICGALTDLGTGGVGFFAIALTLGCYFEANIFESYFVPSFVTVSIVSVIAVSCIIGLYFLFFMVMAGVSDCGYVFVNHYISRIVYTLVMIIPFYFFNRFLYGALK